MLKSEYFVIVFVFLGFFSWSKQLIKEIIVKLVYKEINCYLQTWLWITNLNNFFFFNPDLIGSFQLLLCFFVAAMIKFTFTQLGQVLTPQQYVTYNVVIIIIISVS